MHIARVYDTTDSMLDFDLRHILAALGAQATECSWMMSGVAAYDEAFDATGEQA
ncbi:hypothetical protein [uncultured Methylobacterium sp.]|uniref:hypothetical protein n=1 Tax=uncultured Methylobacterium sp. TaxID=157278 RepID=UPI0035CBB339